MQERSIFMAALERETPAERSAFLDEACANDPALRQRVEELLTSHVEAGAFLEKPVAEHLAEQHRTPRGSEETQSPLSAADDEEALECLAPSDKPGSLGRLGHYEVLEIVGRGGMGIVLRASDEKLQRVVAIKVMAAQLASSAAARKRFIREAQAAAAISHDHVVTIHAVEEAGGLPYLAMQYVSGMSLQERLDKSGPLELREIVRIGMQTAAGLAAAHAQGLIHRDIKPANILLENGVERVKITDFGLARAVADASMTQAGMVAGTPQYMSPEQARGETVDRRSDLFSLGSVLYAMCTGRPPFRGDSGISVLKRVCDDTPRPIRETNPDIPEWLEAIVAKLHAKDPAERYQTAAEVAELLNEHLAHLQHPSVVPLPAAEKPARLAPVRRRLWAIAVAVLLCVATGLGLTEAAGVTKLTASVIRVLTPEGTLVVETDDPAVKVTIEGDGGLVITGAGPHEVRLKPGSYKLQADKNGQRVPLERELVSIAKGGREVVRVKLETLPAPAVAKSEQSAFVLLAAGKDRKFDTLAEAVQRSSDGDTIEVRGNGPFACGPVKLTRALTIRAADGFRPVLQFDDNLQTNAPLVLEGLELQRVAQKVPQGSGNTLVFAWGSPSLHIVNCRFREHLRLACVRSNAPHCVLRNCEFLSPMHQAAHLDGKQCVIDNCLAAGGGLLLLGFRVRPDEPDISVQLTRSTLRSSQNPLLVNLVPIQPDKFAEKDAKRIWIDASGTIFDSTSVVVMNEVTPFLARLRPQPEEAKELLLRMLAWRDRGNLYAPGSSVFLWNQPPEGVAREIGPRSLADWKRLWASGDGDAVEGRVKYQGGDLLARLSAAPEKLTPEDFRLRPDSPGCRAGKDGKDLGADVDLVGPGPGYERWKKTPQYQEWLEETAKVKKAELPKGEPKAFVLQGGKGVAERKFDTLADAVQRASGGDTIEIRGNGPFFSEPINIQRTALTIRAGEGFRPVIKLSPGAVPHKGPLLLTKEALVLEGLELHRAPAEIQRSADEDVIAAHQAPLRVANCRFRGSVFLKQLPVCVLQNCEFLAEAGSVAGPYCPGARYIFENCLHGSTGTAIGLNFDHTALHDVSIQIKRSTFANLRTAIFLPLLSPLPADSQQPKAAQPFHLEVSGCIFGTQNVLGFAQTRAILGKAAVLEPAEAESALLRLLQWRGEHNDFAAGSTSVKWFADFLKPPQPPRGPKSLEDWKQFWGSSEAGSLEGRIRFQGGNLASRGEADLDQLTPDDFRLRPDSAGYRAGPDGKDLGADVDLVGPGAAYERWKKTPEYQTWLKDTGQLRELEAEKPETGAFVLLGGTGVLERRFETLSDAVQRANDGDTIEIRGNGPFLSEPINCQKTSLTIRAADGFRPVIKLSPGALQGNAPLLGTNAALVLEGLDFQAELPEDRKSIQSNNAPLRAANCRFNGGIWMSQSPVCVFRNCEFLVGPRHWWSCFAQQISSGARILFENCLCRSNAHAISLFYAIDATDDVSMQITRSTFTSKNAPLALSLQCPMPAGMDGPKASKPIRLEVSRSVFDSSGILAFGQQQGFTDKVGVLPSAEADAMLLRLLEWRGEWNLFPAGSNSVHWYTNFKAQPPRGPKGLDEWKKFSGSKEADSRDGRPRFHGGNLLARAELDQLTPEDFRLRPDSAGYRAGPDGKDLGADVDLVGPGAAYERWKKTPEYPEWLKETGQLKERATAKPETGAFVVQGGKGVAERKFDTLADAVQRASDGDTIEVRGNGPFVSEPINIQGHALTVRAGEGFRPVIKLRAQSWEQGGGTWTAVIKTNAPLLLEGLELQRIDPPTKLEVFNHFILSQRAPLRVANCRFLTPHQNCIWVIGSPLCVVRNCDLLNSDAFAVVGSQSSGGQWIIDNCLQAAKTSLVYSAEDPNPDGGSIQLTRNTSVAQHGVWHTLSKASALPQPDQVVQPIRLEVAQCILDANPVLLFNQDHRFLSESPPLVPAQAEAVLVRLLSWQGRDNLYGNDLMAWAVGAMRIAPHGPKSLADWKQFWKSNETGSVQGQVRYQGGDLRSRMATAPEKLTPDDFRLRPDSAGYRAGPDGKDLGADVDLVGPGAAYDRWKKTPDYQDWLKETGQKK